MSAERPAENSAATRVVARAGAGLTVAVVATVALASWVPGHAAWAVALGAGMATSNLVDDRLSGRSVSWWLAVAQAVVTATATWLLFRWLAD